MEFLDKTLIYQGETREINSDLETNINHLWQKKKKSRQFCCNTSSSDTLHRKYTQAHKMFECKS